MKQKGFTIVELIVVIVVIGILAGISIVSYSYMRQDAMDGKIRVAVKAAGDAIALYESQNGGTRPAQGYLSSGVDSLVPVYLKQGYRDGLESRNSSGGDYIILMFGCNDGSGGFIMYAALNNPTSKDLDNFESKRNACHPGEQESVAPTTGPVRYNYAQTF